MFSHVIVAWDGSQNARRAFEFGMELAARFQSRLRIVAVARSAEHAETASEREATLQESRAFFEKRSGELVALAGSRGIPVQVTVIAGTHPAEDVVNEARRSGADLIVVGRRGMAPVERFMLGSVSDRISRYAPCPVLIVGGT